MAAVAVRVFGTPITQGTLTQRAQAALKYQNADGNLDQLFQQVSLQSQKVAAGRSNVTPCVVYNAAGDTMTYVAQHVWAGTVVECPDIIQNGQGVIFVHLGGMEGSVAVVVYKIQCCYFLMAWNNPLKGRNSVYCEINGSGYFDWDEIYKKLMSSGCHAKASMSGYTIEVSIHPDGDSPGFCAIVYRNK